MITGMKTSNPDTRENMEAMPEEPVFSFAHLAACFPHNGTDPDLRPPAYGFSSPREEALYETGILFKSFMKC